MKRLHNQKGSIHAVAIIVLVVILLGTLGYVLFQNLGNFKTTSNTSQNTNKTYTFPDTGSSFEYAPRWRVNYAPIDMAEGRFTASAFIVTDDEAFEGSWLDLGIIGTNLPDVTLSYADVVYAKKTAADLYITCTVGPAIAGTEVLPYMHLDYGLSDAYDPSVKSGKFAGSFAVKDNQRLVVNAFDIEVASRKAAKEYCETPDEYTAEQFQMLESFKP